MSLRLEMQRKTGGIGNMWLPVGFIGLLIFLFLDTFIDLEKRFSTGQIIGLVAFFFIFDGLFFLFFHYW